VINPKFEIRNLKTSDFGFRISDFGFGISDLELSMPRQLRNPRRSAFTIIELLIVLAIIAIILSLTLAAVQAIFGGQDKKNTELTIKRLDEAIKAQMRAVIDQAKEKDPPPGVVALAGGDMRRAKVIWIKLQLKRNFPMTFREAIAPHLVDGVTVTPYLTAVDLPPLKQFVDAVNAVVATGPITPAGQYTPDEASHLMYLSLSIDRRGTKFVPEQQLGPASIYQDPSGQGGLNGFKDAWDQPLTFFRWPTHFADNLKATINGANDLQDPERTLLDVNWNNQAQWTAKGGVYWFEQLCHLVHDPTAATWTPVSFYAPPAIVSGGPDKLLGFLRLNSPPASPPPPEVLLADWPTYTANFGMWNNPVLPTDPALNPSAIVDAPKAYENIINYTLK
jgi:prepilin-type N-terminal cleavage/methylation domain-containing protein